MFLCPIYFLEGACCLWGERGVVEMACFVMYLLLKVALISYVHSRTLGTRTSVLAYAIPKSVLGHSPVVRGGGMMLVMATSTSLARRTPRFALAPNTAVSPTDKARHSFAAPRFCAMASRSKG